MTPPLAAALDLGSTRIKAGLLGENGRLVDCFSEAAPPLRGDGLLREGDGPGYLAAARRLLGRVDDALPRGAAVGVTSQRSSFLLWHASGGEAATPLISWQDRRGDGWSFRHRELAPMVERRTGLALSGHYVGPKLAALREIAPTLGKQIDDGELLFGNLDTYLLWHESERRTHRTDGTMAARTTLYDLESADWHPELLSAFDVPRPLLPDIARTAGQAVALPRGLSWNASIADQAAGALAVLQPGADTVLVTLGTGGFVLRPATSLSQRRPGYLFAPILCGAGADRDGDRFVSEGTVNGAGAALDRFAGPAAPLPESRDPTPHAFCLPDVAGLGSPYWRADLGLTFSPAAEGLSPPDQRRVVLEGLIFRIRELLDDLECSAPATRILLSGGVTREPTLAPALAALLRRPVETLDDPEAGLLGTARLAAGLDPFAAPITAEIPPSPSGAYLPEKYPLWQSWLRDLL